jgi:DNA-binding NarL/FixJ family response regulator
MPSQSILIVDDHRLFAEGLRSLLTLNGFEVSGILDNGKALLQLEEEQMPRLLLLDITMEDMDGIELSAIIKKKYPAVNILIISMHSKRVYIEKLLHIGIDGYILKNAGDDELKTAVASILGGERYFSVRIRDIVLKSMLPSSRREEPVLTPREKNILHLIAEGNSTKEIAMQLFVSINTVETHRKNMLLKTGLRNVAHLIKWAYDNGQI